MKGWQAENIDSSNWYDEEIVNNEGKSATKVTQVDHFWRKTFKIKLSSGPEKHTALPKVIKTLLSIHRGNSDVEWYVSDDKKVVTSEGVYLGRETIKDIRRTKELPQGSGGGSNVQVDKVMVEAAKNSHQVYAKWLEEQAKGKLAQKQKLEETKKKKKWEEMQRLELKKEVEKKSLQSLEKDLDQEHDATAKLIYEGSQHLSIALSENYMGNSYPCNGISWQCKQKDDCCSGDERNLVIGTKASL